MRRTERRMSPGKIEKEGKYSVEIAYFFDIMLWKAVIYREEFSSFRRIFYFSVFLLSAMVRFTSAL